MALYWWNLLQIGQDLFKVGTFTAENLYGETKNQKMKQMKITLIAFTLLISSFLRADEGMWLPFMLGRNYEDMKKHGLNLTQEEIYSINNSSLKDAVISFGGFFTV